MPYAFLPDSSVLMNGKILELLRNGILQNHAPTPSTNEYLHQTQELEIVLSRVVLAEIENQANRNKSMGSVGLEAIQELYALTRAHKIKTRVIGERPTLEQIRLNSGGELDAAIRRDALEIGGILVTGDNIQASMALIEGLEVIFSTSTEVAPATPSPKSEEKVRHIEDFFDDQTMSVHLIGHCVPLVKRGQPGDWRLEQIGSTPLEPKELEEIAVKILTEAKTEEGCFIERDLPGVQVVQRRKYRIVICRPPFSNVMEITIVRPLVSLTLDDYKLPKLVLDRLEIAEGILVAGAPGAGKSTFISALTAFYQKKHKIVKTLESVRDLVVSPEVIQYSPLDGNMEKTADILLLVRPDYTIFDEVRVESDFKIFGDMRLAGVGMVGVVHASRAVDAIQRFIRRIELGVIPNIIDTIIFIRSGQIEEVLSTHMVVKTPTGFTDRDLARPVIEVRDFLNNGLLYEIYAFGSDVVVAPVGRPDTRRNPLRDRFTAKGKRLPPREARMQRLQEMIDDDKEVSEDDEHEAQNGADLGASNGPEGNLNVYLSRRSKSIVLMVGARVANDYLHFFTEDGGELFAATLNRRGEVAIKKNSPLYNRLEKIMHNGTRLYGKRE